MILFLKKHIERLISWYIRRSPATKIWKGGIYCLIAAACTSDLALRFWLALFGWVVDERFQPAEEVFLTIEPIVSVAFVLLLVVGLILIATGVVWEIRIWQNEQSANSAKIVLAVEIRGLRDFTGIPIASAIPETAVGRREPLLYDIRQYLDGKISDPYRALEKLSTLPLDLVRFEQSRNREETSIFVGGLAPVPFLFLAGVMLDNEGKLEILDWDRSAQLWKEIDSEMTWSELVFSVPDVVGREVVLAASISYTVDLPAIRQEFGDCEISELSHVNPNSKEHWSDVAQASWGDSFFEAVKRLSTMGAERIHLILAAPSSVALNFGRIYDKRNLPEIVVYQYERSLHPKYPWGVLMPVNSRLRAQIVRRDMPAEPRLV